MVIKILGSENMASAAEKKELKRFGFTFSAVFMLWWLLFFVHRRQGQIYFLILAALFSLPALFLPHLLRPLQKGWMAITICLNWVVKIIVLNFIFFLVITPTALLAKGFGRKFLDLTFRDNKNSYWVSRKRSKSGKNSYVSQF